MATESDRKKRICDVCGQVDDHPRHQVAYPPGQAPAANRDHAVAVVGMGDLTDEQKADILGDIYDTTLQLRHMDCCRSVGCPTGECDDVPDLRGMELVEHITGGND